MSLGNARTAVSRIVRARVGSKRDARAWYRIIKAKAPGAYVLKIEGDIGVDKDDEGNVIGVSAATFNKQLRSIRDMKTLRVDIFSPGGNVFDGIQIYNALRALSKAGVQVKIRIGALAASIASVIAMAGDVVEIHEESSFMIHDPWTAIEGNAAELRKTANMLEKLRSTMMSAYSRKNPGMPADELEALIKAETWFTGTEAVEAGFADVLLSEALDSEALASAAVIVKAMAKPKTKAKAKAEGDEEDYPNAANDDGNDEDDPNAADDGDDEDQPQDMAGIAAALGAIAETLQEVLDAVTASDDDDGEDEPNAADDEDDGDGADDEDDPNAEDDDEEKQARAAARRRARAKARKPVARKPVNVNSKAYLALKKIAKANGQFGSFVTYVSAGASLKQLQDKFLDGESDVKNRVRSTAAAARTTNKATKLDPDAYYATLNGKKKKEA